MSVANRRKREREERRQSILDAAAVVFESRGYAQATMEQVAAEAELSKGTLYLYFKNKDDLFLALSADLLSEIVDTFHAIGAGDGSGCEKIRRMLLAYAEQAASHPDHFRSVVMFLASGHQVDTTTPAFMAHRQRIQGLISAMSSALTEGQADGSVRADLDPLNTVSRLWGGVFGVVQFHINGDEFERRLQQAIDRDSFIDGYVDLLVEGLRNRSNP